jgi:hypothetical protein
VSHVPTKRLENNSANAIQSIFRQTRAEISGGSKWLM